MQRNRIIAIGVTAALTFGSVGWATAAGAGEGMGVRTAARNAKIVVADQVGAKGSVTIADVIAPADGFVVVHQWDGTMPGKRVGHAAVPKGESRDVKVQLDGDVPLTPQLVAAVHLDAGTKGKLDFDMDNMERSSDRPFFVGDKEVAMPFRIATFGIPVKMGEAEIQAGDQRSGDSLTIAKVVAPNKAFVVVHKAKPDGMPGERVGYAPVEAGVSTNVKVELNGRLTGTTEFVAAVHTDANGDGVLDFDMKAPVDSQDQPFMADGMEVATRFKAGAFGVSVDAASLKVSDQLGAKGELLIDSVDAPEASWIVVHKAVDGAPGERVGLARVAAGESKNVKVKLTQDVLPEQLIVALHADRGTSEVFDFDMMNKLGSADQPYFVDGQEVAKVVSVRSFGYPSAAGTADITVSAQVVRNGLLLVDQATAPEPAWIVVHLDAGGKPGARVGLLHVGPGVTSGAAVQLDASKRLTDKVFVAVHADRGQAGLFEFDMMDRANSADQPFFVSGKEVATGVAVR